MLAVNAKINVNLKVKPQNSLCLFAGTADMILIFTSQLPDDYQKAVVSARLMSVFCVDRFDWHVSSKNYSTNARLIRRLPVNLAVEE